jgi:hypothetical protein
MWKRRKNTREVDWVEFKFKLDGAGPIVPEIVGEKVPAGVDPGKLIGVLELARAVEVSAVEIGVVREQGDDDVVSEGRLVPSSWWAETRDRDGEVRRVSGHASPGAALVEIVGMALSTKSAPRPRITWTDATWCREIAENPRNFDRADLAAAGEPNSGRTFQIQVGEYATYCIEPGGMVAGWSGPSARLVGFRRDITFAALNVGLSDFYSSPQRVLEMYPVFEFTGHGRWTHEEPIVSVRAMEEAVQ